MKKKTFYSAVLIISIFALTLTSAIIYKVLKKDPNISINSSSNKTTDADTKKEVENEVTIKKEIINLSEYKAFQNLNSKSIELSYSSDWNKLGEIRYSEIAKESQFWKAGAINLNLGRNYSKFGFDPHDVNIQIIINRYKDPVKYLPISNSNILNNDLSGIVVAEDLYDENPNRVTVNYLLTKIENNLNKTSDHKFALVNEEDKLSVRVFVSAKSLGDIKYEDINKIIGSIKIN